MIVAGVSERHCIAYVTVLSFLTYRSAFGFTGIPVPSGLSQQQFLRTAFAARSPSSPQHIYSNVQQDQSRGHHFTRRRNSSRSTALLCHQQRQWDRRRRPRPLHALFTSAPWGVARPWTIPRNSPATKLSAADDVGGHCDTDGSENERSRGGRGDEDRSSSGADAPGKAAAGPGVGAPLAAASAAGLGQASISDEAEGAGSKLGPPKWAPRWAVDIHPLMQLGASVGLYFFHMLFLSKSGINFPVQLIPNNHGLCQSVGLDTATGFAVLGAAGWARVRSGASLLPRISEKTVPWKLNKARLKKKLPITFIVLIVAYLLSGLGAQFCEYLLFWLSLSGLTMSVAMHRSIQVLVSHLLWVVMGVRIIGLAMKPFFFNREKGSWVDMKWRSNWLWWVVGGYFVSSSMFNVADLANQFLCPLPPDTESVVVKIINPENNDVVAMAMGSIAPCLSAPWWEEVLYRGFLLPALTVYLPVKAAIPSGAVLFALHHMNLQAMLPLSCLGLIWSLLYLYSGNLLVTVLVHAMWNSRVFLGSLLGL